MDANAAWKLGSTIEGKYRLGELLATGGQGEVYAAEHVRTGERVAVKCMGASVAGRPELVDRMLHEARVTAALRHANHVAIRDCNVVDGRVYIVMELLEGRDCRAVLADDGPMSIGRAIYVVTEAACGIAAAHEKRVVHRDLKPENLFICSDNSVKVLDYGTSKSQCGGRWITDDGLIAGTLAYMPPERLAGDVGDERVDIFALGVILMELILGRHPHAKGPLSWPSESKLRKLMKQWDPETLTAIRERVPREIWKLFAKATARDPECRFTDMAEFRDSLCEALEKSAPAAFLLSTETPARPTASRLRAPGSERTFAVRVLEQTPVMRPAVGVDLAADTPVVSQIQYVLPHRERERARRNATAASNVDAEGTSSLRQSCPALSAPVDIPMHRMGRRAHIAMSLAGIAAAFAMVRLTSGIVHPAAAGGEPRFSVQQSAVGAPVSPMMTAQAAFTADRDVDVALQEVVAATTNLMPRIQTAGGKASAVRNSGKAVGKRKLPTIDIARVSSGLEAGPITSGKAGRSEGAGKPSRKLSEDLFVWSRDESVLAVPAQDKRSGLETGRRKNAPPDAAHLLIETISSGTGE